MTDRAKLTKVIDGLYQIDDITVARDGKQWFLTSRRIQGQPRFRKLAAAAVAARVYLGEEIDELDRVILHEGAI